MHIGGSQNFVIVHFVIEKYRRTIFNGFRTILRNIAYPQTRAIDDDGDDDDRPVRSILGSRWHVCVLARRCRSALVPLRALWKNDEFVCK